MGPSRAVATWRDLQVKSELFEDNSSLAMLFRHDLGSTKAYRRDPFTWLAIKSAFEPFLPQRG